MSEYPEHIAVLVALNNREKIVWVDEVNSTLTNEDSDIEKTSGGAGSWDAGANSTRLLQGDGAIEVTVDVKNKNRMFGFSESVSSPPTWTDLAFGIHLRASTDWQIAESGVLTAMGFYNIGDIFRIEIIASEVKYYKNGVLKHTSTNSPSFPMYAEVCLYTLNATLIDTYLEGSLSGSDAGTPDYTELEDLLTNPAITIHRGISGTTYRDRVASTGTMNFALDNSEKNSEGLLGLYSYNNTNCLTGWKPGIPVKCVVTYLGDEETVFVGTIEKCLPVSGKYGSRMAKVFCVDWMEEAAKARITGLEVQTDIRSNEVLSILLAAIERQPLLTQIGYGGDTYPYALDNAFDESLNALSEFQRLAISEFGYIFVNREGALVFQGRHYRPNKFSLDVTLTDADIFGVEGGLTTGRGREDVVNRAQIQVYPRRIDSAATSVLFSLASTPQILRFTSITLNAPYRDPDARATRVGGVDMVTPVATTDYTFNTAEDGSGTDITSDISITVSFYGNSADLTIENTGNKDGYLTKCQLRGKGIYAYESVLVSANNEESKTRFGETVAALSMPYQSESTVASDAANFLVAMNKDLLTQVDGVTFLANAEERLMTAALTSDISSRVRVEETVLGTAGHIPIGETQMVSALEFFIQSVDLTINEAGVIICKWTLSVADAFNYWILEVDGATELDETTRLGYGSFLPGWQVDISELGTDTRVNV